MLCKKPVPEIDEFLNVVPDIGHGRAYPGRENLGEVAEIARKVVPHVRNSLRYARAYQKLPHVRHGLAYSCGQANKITGQIDTNVRIGDSLGNGRGQDLGEVAMKLQQVRLTVYMCKHLSRLPLKRHGRRTTLEGPQGL
jgi:hypothetical protein